MDESIQSGILLSRRLERRVQDVVSRPDPETGEEGGMVAVIAENRPYEFISIKHIGMINNGVEDTTSEEATKWTPAYENYTFKEKDGRTEVLVKIDIEEEYHEIFEEMWPQALQRLKELSEKD